MKRVIDGNFIFHQDGALMLINTGNCYSAKHPSSVWPQNGPELNSHDDEI